MVIVLLLDKQYKPNNVVAYNNNGDKVWEINDILRSKKPSGFDEIEKKTNAILSAYCITGILYDIDIANKKIVSSVFLGQFDFLEEKIREEIRKLIWQTEPILSEDKCIIHGGVLSIS